MKINKTTNENQSKKKIVIGSPGHGLKLPHSKEANYVELLMELERSFISVVHREFFKKLP